MAKPAKFISRTSVLAVPVAAVLAAACVQVPPVPETIQAAEAAIQQAENQRAAEFAAMELSGAREKLALARDSADRNRDYRARKYAVAAKLDAELAASKAESARAQTASAETRKEIEFMRLEMELDSGRRGPPARQPSEVGPPASRPYDGETQ